MNVSRIILILVANRQEIFGEWLINPRPKTESSEVTLLRNLIKVKVRKCVSGNWGSRTHVSRIPLYTGMLILMQL